MPLKFPKSERVLVVTVLALAGLSLFATQEDSSPGIRDDLEVVLELLAKRQLTEKELDAAVLEFQGLFDTIEACRESLEANRELVGPMVERQGEPIDVYLRHFYSELLYFSPTQAGSLIQGLSDETDPIQVADKKCKRILTRQDAVGLLNIAAFLELGGTPTEQDFPDEDVQELISLYREEFEMGYRKLPYRLSMGAELWAGLVQNWKKLTAQERERVLNYLSPRAASEPLGASVYKNWLGLTAEEATEWLLRDEREYRQMRLDRVVERELQRALAKYDAWVYYLPW